MGLEELPDDFIGGEVAASFADQELREVLFSAGPGVATTDDAVESYCGVLVAAGINFATRFESVWRFGWKSILRCSCGAAIEPRPRFGAILSRENHSSGAALHFTTRVWNQRIIGSINC